MNKTPTAIRPAIHAGIDVSKDLLRASAASTPKASAVPGASRILPQAIANLQAGSVPQPAS